MNKLFAIALAATAFAASSAPAEARDYCYSDSYHYRPSYRRVVVVQPAYGRYSSYSYHRNHRYYDSRSCDRHEYHHHHRSHGVRGFLHRVFR